MLLIHFMHIIELHHSTPTARPPAARCDLCCFPFLFSTLLKCPLSPLCKRLWLTSTPIFRYDPVLHLHPPSWPSSRKGEFHRSAILALIAGQGLWQSTFWLLSLAFSSGLPRCGLLGVAFHVISPRLRAFCALRLALRLCVQQCTTA